MSLARSWGRPINAGYPRPRRRGAQPPEFEYEGWPHGFIMARRYRGRNQSFSSSSPRVLGPRVRRSLARGHPGPRWSPSGPGPSEPNTSWAGHGRPPLAGGPRTKRTGHEKDRGSDLEG